jgi:hypothetical protein|tara:strand:- start:2758 stop:3360 length:603 start_codon:yes stop_codon:yes gene_type:complete
MLKIITVLKSGGEFRREHVEKIKDMAQKYITNHEFLFICLTDDASEDYDLPLVHNWPRWWSKMEMFNIKGPALFFDLDTIITSNIDDVIESLKDEEFVTLRDAYRKGSNIGSGIMSWKGDVSYLYHAFEKDAGELMRKLRGDQDFIQKAVKQNTFIQDYSSGVVSFKGDIGQGKQYNKEKHKIVFFHGRPRPWQQDIVEY